jgi:tetratricopeptide (TPR) repeat protein
LFAAPAAIARGAATAALDVYGLTATLYHLLTLRPPYAGNAAEVLAQLPHRDPVPAYKLLPGMPRDLQAILDRGMARDPGARYQSAHALEQDLLAFLDHRPVTARPVSALGRLWRRAKRSREARAAAVVGLLAAAGASAVWLHGERAQARAEAWLAAWAQLPPALALNNARDREIADPDRRAQVAALLDRAAELAASPVPSRMLRAAFRLDHGDAAGARADVAAIAAGTGGPFARALAGHYAALPADAKGAASLSLEGLPEPRSREDRVLAAFHALRPGITAESVARAHALLDDPSLLRYAPALELAIPVALQRTAFADDRSERLALARHAHELALQLEGIYGRPTATTRQFVAAALLVQGHYADAIAPLRTCLELSPWAAGPRINLAHAYARTGDHAAAAACLEEALRLSPHAPEAGVALAELQAERGEFGAALATIAALQLPPSARGDRRARLEGRVHLAHALAADRAGDAAAALAAAERAISRLEAAVAAGEAAAQLDLEMSRAVIARDFADVLPDFLETLARDPLNRVLLENLAHVMPDEMSRDQVDALRAYLRALADYRAPAATGPQGSTPSRSPKR